MKFNFKIFLYFFIIVFCCTLFNLYIWFQYKKLDLTIASIIFSGLIILLSIIFIYILKRHMENVLVQLSEVISSITDMREQEVFSSLNDDMLSKLQSQVTKLTSLLRAQNNRIKNEGDEIKALVSDMAHQLKTPLANLNLYYEFLQDKSISQEDFNEFNFNLKNQIEKLNFLLQSMIKMSRLESGIIKIKPTNTNLNDVCLMAIKQVYKKAKDKNVEIKFDSNKELVLFIDKNWTAEAIFNILDNAVKYSNAYGIIQINIKKYEMFVRIDIEDNGIGIEEKEINNIFKRFYRGKGGESEEGVGIGLYLSRKIIEKQDGYIKVKSKSLKGSIFSVFLPC